MEGLHGSGLDFSDTGVILAMISTLPLPVFSIYILCSAALGFYIYNIFTNVAKNKLGLNVVLQRRSVNVLFLIILLVNLLMSIVVFIFCRIELQPAISVVSAGNNDFLNGGSHLLINRSYYVDTLSAWSVISTSLVALIIGLHAMVDKINRITPLRVACILSILASVEGIYYSNSLYSIYFFILMSQIASYGLFKHAAVRSKRLMPIVVSHLSRIISMLFLLGGFLMLSFKYGPSITKLITLTIEIGAYEKISFSLICASLLAFFLRSSSNAADAVYRTYFGMRIQVIFFVLTRIIFGVFGAVHGFEKIPNILIFAGIATILFSLFMAVSVNKPMLWGAMICHFMKGFLVTAMGIAYYGCFSAEGIAQYGFTALESMFVLWLIYLPLIAIVCIVTVFLERRTEDGVELYKKSGLLSLTPTAMVVFYFVMFAITGMPPFATYPLMQLLYRSANFVYPFLAVFLVVSVLALFFVGLYTISMFALGKAWTLQDKENSIIKDSEIVLPVVFLTFWFILLSFFPGFAIQKIVVPSVESLMNTSVSIDAIQEVGK